jgi:hypothetical protein
MESLQYVYAANEQKDFRDYTPETDTPFKNAREYMRNANQMYDRIGVFLVEVIFIAVIINGVGFEQLNNSKIKISKSGVFSLKFIISLEF